MLRKLLLLIVLILVLLIALVGLGIINLRQGSDGSVAIETKDVQVGTTSANISVPVVRMEERRVELPSVGVQGNNQPEASNAAAVNTQ